MNAILGITRPGDFGADMSTTTSTRRSPARTAAAAPARARSPSATSSPRTCRRRSSSKDGDRYRLDYDRPKSIGRVRSFFGNVGILFRGYCYIRTLGPDGLQAVSENAVLNANYLLSRVKHVSPVPHGDRCMHEFVASGRDAAAREEASRAMDIAKRLLDYGFHAPTVYFPLVVPEALMIEPTETESKETLDAFADTLLKIKDEDAELLQHGPAHARRSAGRTR